METRGQTDCSELPVSKAGAKLSKLLPLELGLLRVQPLSWSDFQGVPEDSPYSAHIYWNITYEIVDCSRRQLKAQLHCSSRSWVRPERMGAHLLNHEQGHFLIGAICMLEFVRRVQTSKSEIQNENYAEFVGGVFQRTLREYLDLEKRYDQETEHRLNPGKQEEWDNFFLRRLGFFRSNFSSRKNRFRVRKRKTT